MKEDTANAIEHFARDVRRVLGELSQDYGPDSQALKTLDESIEALIDALANENLTP